MGGDSKLVNESNKPGYDETLKTPPTPPTIPMPIYDDDDDENLYFHGNVVLSKIEESENFNDTEKISIKNLFSYIFSKLLD